ncbi:MAG: hypothetical protein KGZ79_03035 [Dethiobacter sp.]|jgi:hypothetical protein|nr:hypothetical protein [Dethiobacter sp.]
MFKYSVLLPIIAIILSIFRFIPILLIIGLLLGFITFYVNLRILKRNFIYVLAFIGVLYNSFALLNSYFILHESYKFQVLSTTVFTVLLYLSLAVLLYLIIMNIKEKVGKKNNL